MAGVRIFESPVASNVPFDNSTDGFAANNVQAAIEEAASGAHLLATEVGATANATTTSGTDAIITGMTATPAAGTYLVWFSSAINSSQAGATVTVSMYVGGVQRADSVRAVSPFDGGTLSALTASCGMAINGLVTVTGSQAITIEWHTSAGTATCGARTLNYLRV